MRGRRILLLGAFALIVFALAWAAQDAGGLTAEIKSTLEDLPLLHGRRVAADTFDNKVVIVTFFASWCAPCRQEFAHLKQLYAERHQQGLEVIAVNLFENFDNLSNEQRLATFLALTDPPFTVLKGNDVISAQFGTIRRIPTVLIYDRQGRQALRFANGVGTRQMSLDADTLQRVVNDLL